MSIKIDGITRLRANYYNKLVIREDKVNVNYHVNVDGNKINYETETIGNRFSEEFKNKTDDDKIREIVEDYVRNTKICGIKDLVPLSIYNGEKFNIIYGNFGYKEMLLQLYNKDFKDIFDKIKNKYIQDRFDFCYDDGGIKIFKISTCIDGSAYTYGLEGLYRGSKEEEWFKEICLSEHNFRVIDSERKFIEQFILNVFSKFNKEIRIEKIYDNEYEWTRNDVIGFMLICGDVKVYIPKYEPLLFINVIVHNYNVMLKRNKDECKKRQLKMEGF